VRRLATARPALMRSKMCQGTLPRDGYEFAISYQERSIGTLAAHLLCLLFVPDSRWPVRELVLRSCVIVPISNLGAFLDSTCAASTSSLRTIDSSFDCLAAKNASPSWSSRKTGSKRAVLSSTSARKALALPQPILMTSFAFILERSLWVATGRRRLARVWTLVNRMSRRSPLPLPCCCAGGTLRPAGRGDERRRPRRRVGAREVESLSSSSGGDRQRVTVVDLQARPSIFPTSAARRA